MKLFGLFGKEKPVPFTNFRDMVRAAVRRHHPGARMENNENGFILTLDDASVACNLRNLYAAYSHAPQDRDALISAWLDSLVTAVPEHTWVEARLTLRPTLKDAEYLARARAALLRTKDPDELPYAPFAGELSIIVMRDLPGTIAAVTRKQLESWGVTFDQALSEALNNMNMLNFPPVVNSLHAGGLAKKEASDQDLVGLVFRGDHLTATWLVLERFRDHIGQRLRGDYVVFVPARNQLTAIRADELGLITSVQQANRGYQSQPHALTGQCFHVSVATLGGAVTVYQPGRLGDTLAPSSPFAAGGLAQQPAAPPPPTPVFTSTYRPPPRDLNSWWGLSEPTDTEE
ncbi:MAG TPA: hypothetical protein VFB38_11475 [Chthonomonadaceae bacterium]|nr:hypothetical protein [Chthonomonadaceae bacterium]